MKKNSYIIWSAALMAVTTAANAQTPVPDAGDAVLVERPAEAVNSDGVTRDRRAQAYAKLLEGQRHAWKMSRLRSQAAISTSARLAKQAFQRAVELDPQLAEGYTALAEMALAGSQPDIDQAVSLASLAAKINRNNFGAHRILARVYSLKSNLNSATFDRNAAALAVEEWKEVARLDPRNAEAWAFLSELYEKLEQSDARIEALRKWLASAPPVESQFYRRVMGGQNNLSPENASLKLGPALLDAGRIREAVETLSVLVADDPDNMTAVELLAEALKSTDGKNLSAAIDALHGAVYANPENVALVTLLASVQFRAGQIDAGAAVLEERSQKSIASDREAAANMQVALGDLYASVDRLPSAIAAYEKALKYRGLEAAQMVSDDEREFVAQVLGKQVQVLKAASRIDDARDVIERARGLLGNDDLFADRELIALYRESGRRAEALAAVKRIREKLPNDFGFLRLEATLLAEMGKVDEAVALVRSSAAKNTQTAPAASNDGTTIAVAVPPSDEFSNHLFISSLYSEAGRPKEAAIAANDAYLAARGSERKQIAKLTLATAQQMSGDHAAAESTLRGILKDSPGNPIALNNLGYFLLETDREIKEALELIQQAVKVDPTNPSYLDSLGWAYYKLGNLTEAEKHLKDASRADPSSGTIVEHLGDVYFKQRRNDLARGSWQKAEKLFTRPDDLKRVREKLKKLSAK